MSTFSKYRPATLFVGGVAVGIFISLAVLKSGDLTMISQADLDEQARQIAELREENVELTDDLFLRNRQDSTFDASALPYTDDADALSAVASARQQALENGKFLMVTFGANWCLDCRTLHHHLQDPEVVAFTADKLDFVNVSVGKFNSNVELAADLGVDLRRGIPVAVFFGPDGNVIGTTNEGQLEPARFYSSKQILKFVRYIVEKSLIVTPDSVH